MKLLSSAVMPQTLDVKLPAGQYRTLYFHWSGTAVAGQTVAAADLGQVLLSVKGRQYQRLEVSWLQPLNNAEGGIVDTTSAAGGAFSFSARLNQFYDGDLLNILDVQDSDNVRVQVIPASTLAAKVSAGTLDITAHKAVGVQGYIRKLLQRDLSIISGTITERLGEENVKKLFIENNSNITRISVNLDGDNFIDSTRLELAEETNMNMRIETLSLTTPVLVCDLAPTGSLVEAMNDEGQIIIQGGGADTVSIIVEGVDFTPDVESRSKAMAQSAYQTKYQRKAALGKTRPLQVLNGNSSGSMY